MKESSSPVTRLGHPIKAYFPFDSKWNNLNHGSFGTYPIPVRDALRNYQELTEAAPDKFLRFQYVDLLDKAREQVAAILNAPVEECVFVLNATTGINTVLRNLVWEERDAIIYFDSVYGAVQKTLISLVETNPQIHLRCVGDGTRGSLGVPVTHTDILNAFSQTISRLLYEGYRVKVAVFDTVASLPALRFPFERLTQICKEYGIFSVIDGAHGVGQIPQHLSRLNPDFYVTNCHKWLFTPRGCAALFVPKRNQHLIRTTFPTSHGYVPPPSYKIRRVLPPSTKTAFVQLFEFVGTADNSPFYCVPAALDFRARVCGGEDAIYDYIRNVGQRGADRLAQLLGTMVMGHADVCNQPLPGENQIQTDPSQRSNPWTGGLRDCAMANVLMPIQISGGHASSSLDREPVNDQAPNASSQQVNDSTSIGDQIAPVVVEREDVQKHIDWMHHTMIHEYNTFAVVFEYHGQVWVRVSGQIYLELADFELLGETLKTLCERVRRGESLRNE